MTNVGDTVGLFVISVGLFVGDSVISEGDIDGFVVIIVGVFVGD